jgi:peptidoglycan/xylan/chitin deacetylase (PgdA/CDA1 family)/TolA-binding protein
VGVVCLLALVLVVFFSGERETAAPQKLSVHLLAEGEPTAAIGSLSEAVRSFRRIIVLTADEGGPREKRPIDSVGLELYHELRARKEAISVGLAEVVASNHPSRFAVIEGVLTWIEQDGSLRDADRLAFREILQDLQKALETQGALNGLTLRRRIASDLVSIDDIEAAYEKEFKAVFGRFEGRAIERKREKWDAYVKYLQSLENREAILKAYGVIVPYEEPANTSREIFGTALPPKTLVLTFDDGPHPIYTLEISRILKQRGIKGGFFDVGSNLGDFDPSTGAARLSSRAQIGQKLEADGHFLANHSFTHAKLSSASDTDLLAEVGKTDRMLLSVSPTRSSLFRFPYGARNKAQLKLLEPLGLTSVMWNIDSLDWADPLPASITARVLQTVEKEGRGIVLFHDIHERTMKALPEILDALMAQGYEFASWNGTGFATTATKAPAPMPTSGYRESFALVIGIDEYAAWPKLSHAVRDAQAVRNALIENLSFKPDNVVLLKNGEATRAAIIGALTERMASQTERDDRVFVFFAGHGATQTLTSGRDLGYIIPVDAHPDRLAAEGIPMTEIQNVSEGLKAKHVLFVMDSCYSGLGLVRGASQPRFLQENARRVARQMLTAGGSEQVVADNGPGGHSVFTWTFLQAIEGRADLNGDGLITGTELAAFVAPAVSNSSRQTPGFGSLPGSEGGEFIFELKPREEFIAAGTSQSDPSAIVTAPAPTKGTVAVMDLEGNKQNLALAKPAQLSPRQAAQRANDRGLLLYRDRKYAEAEAEFTEALRLRPDFALAANNLGFVFYRRLQYAEAVRWFENTIAIDRDRAIAYFNLGEAAEKKGDISKARSAYAHFIELQPRGTTTELAKSALGRLVEPPPSPTLLVKK